MPKGKKTPPPPPDKTAKLTALPKEDAHAEPLEPPAGSQVSSQASPTPAGGESPKWETWGGRALKIISIVTALFGIYVWLGARIDSTVKTRIEPYEHFLLGLGAVHDEEYDRAVPELDKAFDALQERGDAKEQLVPLIDYYLYAVVNSKHPADYSSRFNKVKKVIDEHAISPDAFCFHQLGWYYLRTGELEQARPQFLRAKDKYAEEDRPRAAADTYWALALIELADGKTEAAVENAREASRKNPVKYDLKQLVQDQGAMREDNWYQVLMRLYPKIDFSWSTFFSRLEASNTHSK